MSRAARIARRLRASPKGPRSRAEIRRTSRQILEEGPCPIGTDPLGDRLSMLMTFKIMDDDRASILDTVLHRVDADLAGADIPILVADASPPVRIGPIRDKIAGLSPRVAYRQMDLPMSLGYLELLGSCDTRHCYLQFDDQLTTNLSPQFLAASSKLLDRYPQVPVVSAVWPLDVSVVETGREVRVLTHSEHLDASGKPAFRFAESKGVQRPVIIEEIDGFRFGIFENFYYGFSFFHIVTRTEDYQKRLRWYLDNLGTVSVHDIELAAAYRTLGPFWTHLGVCLDGVSVLDLDYSHTGSSVRPHASTARDVHRAVKEGYDIVAEGAPG